MNLFTTFVNDFFRTDDAETLLRDYECLFDPWENGYQGGATIRVEGRFFQPDENGAFHIVTPVYDGPTPTLYEPVDDPVIADLLAWHPSKPGNWRFLRGEAGLILGEPALFEASLFDIPLRLHQTPFSWLQSGCKGSVLLDPHGLNRLYGLKEIICESIDHGERIEMGLSLYYRKNMPHISVPTIEKQLGETIAPNFSSRCSVSAAGERA